MARKRSWRWLMMAVPLLLICSTTFAQGQETEKRQGIENARSEARRIVGFAIRDSQGEEIGEVDNILVIPDGNIFAVLEIGGFLGIGEDKVIVPLDQLKETGQEYVVFTGTRQELENLPRYEEGSSRRYIRRNYRVVGADEASDDTSKERSGQDKEQSRKKEQQKKAEGGKRQERYYREGDKMVSTLTFPAPEGRGEIVLEREGMQQVRAGESYAYTLRITNQTEYPVHDVVVKEYLTGNIEVEDTDQKRSDQKEEASESYFDEPQKSEKDESKSGKDRPNKWEIGTLSPGESRTIKVTAIARGQGEAKSCIILDYQPSLCNMFKIVKPELQLTRKIVNADGEPVDIAYVCSDVNIIYTLENTGTGTTREATIKEELPKMISLKQGEGNVSIPVEPLKSGQKVEKQVTISAKEPTEFSGRASATTDQTTVYSDRSGIRLVKPEITLSLDGPKEEYLGRALTYRIRLENTGDITAYRTVVKLNLPRNIKQVTTSSQKTEREGNQFKVGRLDGGQSREFSITFQATETGELTVEAEAEAYCAASGAQTVTTMVKGIPAALIEAVDRVDPVKVGEETVYEIRVENQGSAEDLNVKLSGKLPKELSFVDGQGDTQVSGQGQQVDFGTIKSLPPGEVVSWNVTAKGEQAGKSKFRLELISDANKEPVIEMEPTTVY